MSAAVLSLPIVIGREYMRRDGVIVTAKQPNDAYLANYPGPGGRLAWVGDGEPTGDGGKHAYLTTGRVNRAVSAINDTSFDLVADYVEPATEVAPDGGHPHAALMLFYAKDAALTARPWEGWQSMRNADGEVHPWEQVIGHPQWLVTHLYRRKPRTIRIGEVDVPEPLRVAPAVGTTYFYPNMDSSLPVQRTAWNSPGEDIRLLARGLVHLNEDDAVAHAHALIALTAVKS